MYLWADQNHFYNIRCSFKVKFPWKIFLWIYIFKYQFFLLILKKTNLFFFERNSKHSNQMTKQMLNFSVIFICCMLLLKSKGYCGFNFHNIQKMNKNVFRKIVLIVLKTNFFLGFIHSTDYVHKCCLNVCSCKNLHKTLKFIVNRMTELLS